MKTLKQIVFILISWPVVHCTVIALDGLQSFSGKADVAIVFGTFLFRNGTLGAPLKARVDKALELYNNKRVSKFFLSGADAELGYPAQAHGMRNYLLTQGVANSDIFVDTLGINSYHTARNFIRLNKKYSFSSAVVVTSFYHVSRCKYIIKKLGFKNVAGAHSEFYLFKQDLKNLVREFFAFYKYLVTY